MCRVLKPYRTYCAVSDNAVCLQHNVHFLMISGTCVQVLVSRAYFTFLLSIFNFLSDQFIYIYWCLINEWEKVIFQ